MLLNEDIALCLILSKYIATLGKVFERCSIPKVLISFIHSDKA